MIIKKNSNKPRGVNEDLKREGEGRRADEFLLGSARESRATRGTLIG